jgi:hypothetical protein
MGLFGQMARMYVINRMLGRGTRHRPHHGHGHGHRRSRHASRYGRRRRGRGGFFGPFPYYSTRSRRGSRVTVTGCCLPLPLALTLAALTAAGAALRRG